jgi:hypothetical protein
MSKSFPSLTSNTATETETEAEAMHRAFKSMPDRSSHMAFFHDGKRDWASIKHFWSALISRNPIVTTADDDDDALKLSSESSSSPPHPSPSMASSPITSLPLWVTGQPPYGVTDISAIHDCAAEELLGYHARGDKKKGNKRKTFGLR